MSDKHPQKVVAGGAFFTNQQDEILLVNPSYKWQWEIPGGVVEAFESPLAGCIREVKEEIGLDISPVHLLGVDHTQDRSRSLEVIRFIYWGGVLTDDDISAIRLPEDGELTDYGFFSIDDIEPLLTVALKAQLHRIVDVLNTGGVAYGEYEYT